MSYMSISSQENHHFSLCSYFHAHPTTLLLKILGYWGDQCMGRPPTSNFGGTVPPRSPPLITLGKLYTFVLGISTRTLRSTLLSLNAYSCMCITRVSQKGPEPRW